MKKIVNQLILEGESAARIFKASKDLGYPAANILEAAITYGLRPGLKAMAQKAMEYNPEAPKSDPVAEAPVPKATNHEAPVARKPRGRPRAVGISTTVFSVPPVKVSKGKRGRPRSVTPSYQTESLGGAADTQRRRGRPPGSKNKPKSESAAVVSNGSDVTEV